MIVALTGGTGFLGGAVLTALLDRGHDVAVLARRPQPPRERVRWVPGDLSDTAALATLVAGADAIIHVAGAINAPDRDGFADANVAGTARLAAAAETASLNGAGPRFILVSSLSAREPQLSDYGWSKRGGETALAATGLDWTIVRPPAIYGPGDREMLEMFHMAARGLVLLPPPGRLSIIHADDLARLLVTLALNRGGRTRGAIYEVDDGTPDGFRHVDFAHALGDATGQQVRTLSLPRALMMLAARGDRLLRGPRAKLTPDRVRYFCHADWVASPQRAVPADIWTPAIGAPAGLAATAAAYREKGWLR
jgi:uncharacterized protein YbjT (DUF2867 family)